MAFYHVKNRGFDREELQTIMEQASFSSAAQAATYETIRQMFGEKMLQSYKLQVEQESQVFAFGTNLFGGPDEDPKSVIGYRPDAPWLPFFDVNICEGYNASSRDTKILSKAFGAPVLGFSIFDSDILMLSYSDAEQDVNYNYAKPNCEGMEEYDTEVFQTDLPLFLLFLCPELTKEKLKEIWEGDEVFADDRMEKLCRVMGMTSIYSTSSFPDSFERITAQ